MNIKIDREKCIGCGSCVAVCPELFELGGEDNKVQIKEKKQNEVGINVQCAKEAVDICPVQAIEIK